MSYKAMHILAIIGMVVVMALQLAFYAGIGILLYKLIQLFF